jgi:hypothetical protein
MGQVEIRSRVDALIKARERAVVASALTDRDKVLSKLRVWLEGTEVTDSNRFAWQSFWAGRLVCLRLTST